MNAENAVQDEQNGNGDQPRDERQRFGPKYPEEAFIEAIETADHASTGDVADHVGCDHATAYKRLKALEEAGMVESTDLGNNLLWTLLDT